MHHCKPNPGGNNLHCGFILSPWSVVVVSDNQPPSSDHQPSKPSTLSTRQPSNNTTQGASPVITSTGQDILVNNRSKICFLVDDNQEKEMMTSSHRR